MSIWITRNSEACEKGEDSPIQPRLTFWDDEPYWYTDGGFYECCDSRANGNVIHDDDCSIDCVSIAMNCVSLECVLGIMGLSEIKPGEMIEVEFDLHSHQSLTARQEGAEVMKQLKAKKPVSRSHIIEVLDHLLWEPEEDKKEDKSP